MTVHYILARNVSVARDVAESIGWSRIPMESAMLPVYATPKGNVVRYSTCEGLAGRSMDGVLIFLTYGWEQNCLHRKDILDLAVARGAKLVTLYADNEDDALHDEY